MRLRRVFGDVEVLEKLGGKVWIEGPGTKRIGYVVVTTSLDRQILVNL